jgi:DNA repair exonuclease SbcCD ATPase subunit
MKVSVEYIFQKLSQRFPDLEQVDDGVIRFERKAGARPFAVCYVDVSAQIPDSSAALNEYQDRVVARHYFGGSKSLQWSNYLYFLVDTLPSQEAKAIVERDRKYARKFVVTETELDAALSPPSFQVSDETIKTDVLATWTAILGVANLDRAILNDEPLPKRLDLIEAAFGQRAMAVPSASPTPRAKTQPFLRHIRLKHFRNHPTTKEFAFGRVTLICGPNGTGKTSLMEAIELLYCGRTKRNPSAPDRYSIVATFSDNSTEIATDQRAQSLFRDRHLAWYGQSEVRTNNLFQTFARFNFLNTDAAVGLADARDDFEEDLSKLLVGPAASKTWREIERTAEKLDERLRELEAIRNQVDLDLASHKRQIAASSELRQESGAVLQKLDALLAKVLWTRDDGDAIASVNDLIESLSELDTLVKQAIQCDWVGAPVTLAHLLQFAKDTRTRVRTGELLAKQIGASEASQRRVNQELAQIQGRLADLNELLRLLGAGLPERLEEVERLEPLLATRQRAIIGFDDQPVQPLLTQEAAVTVSAYSLSAAQLAEDATRQLKDAQERYAAFCALRDESLGLGQRLREVAAQILEKGLEPDQCPLCRTRFQPGELASHMHAGVDQQVEERAKALLNTISERERSAEAATAAQLAGQWAEDACQRLGLPRSTTISQLMSNVSVAQQDYLDLVRAHSRLVAELKELEESGVTAERYRHLSADVAASFGPITLESLKEVSARLEDERRQKLAERDGFTQAHHDAVVKAEEALAVSQGGAVIASALAQLTERLVVTESLLLALEPYVARFPWSGEQPFSRLAVTIGTVRQIAGDYQITRSKEQSAVKVLAEASHRRDQLATQLAGLIPRIERLNESRQILATIRNEHSLTAAMEMALQQNRTAIEAIFARIHSPAEFSGLGSSMTTLVRKNNSGTATLQQISTGQRAAFALSLFLAQNAQLRSAPPLILIDDPIAHVDDLNCLSFLDYLREIVVAGDRQVVFATANDKLAMLFERKFDFLGSEDFRRYDLKR